MSYKAAQRRRTRVTRERATTYRSIDRRIRAAERMADTITSKVA